MLPHLSFHALNQRILHAKRLACVPAGPPMLGTVQEIAIYIHRFHNLDLFEQGWYRIKITMRLEDNDNVLVGMPSRVVQYEAPNFSVKDSYGAWRIDDTDNSFQTQPFKIKYARQDVLLSLMIAFNLSMGNHVVPSRSAVILKFELIYAPFVEKGSESLGFLDASSVAAHEFRIPPKALLGLHSYCPVHFDAFHAVLVDTSVHITLLKSLRNKHQKILSNDNKETGSTSDASSIVPSEAAPLNSEDIMLVKGLVTARDTLLEEVQKISKAIGHSIDLTDFISQLDDTKLFGSMSAPHPASSSHDSPVLGSQNNVKKTSVFVDFRSNELIHSLSKGVLKNSADAIASQILYLWSQFLNFHRLNKTEILEYLRETWANDRRAEWSIWMVYSKVEIPHDHIVNGGSEVYSSARQGKVLAMQKLSADPAQSAITRAELHRRSISQMRINGRAIQDMQIFGDLSNVPIVIVERVLNAPKRHTSGSSYFINADEKASTSLLSELKAVGNVSDADHQHSSRIIKIVVFVHGFQGHHLDLRLVRNQWLLIDPEVECLMSEFNEDKTFGDFHEMGSRLAKEVKSFLKRKMNKASRYGGFKSIKLSFVGHSIGNVIIRTALADSTMEPYLRFLHTYVSLSGPHLGYLYCSNPLFNSGLWMLKKLKQMQCIHQLTMTDDPDLSNTFFYKLCQRSTLDNFKNIILLSSPQDGYVPYHSARIEHCQASVSDYTRRGKLFLEMLNNCLDQIRAPTVEHRVFMRCDVSFNMSTHGKNLNTFIGRAAHIEFLETGVFAKFIMWSFPELFH